MQGGNPVEYGRELGLHELGDRNDELEEISATIRNRARLFLIGPRRFGKTSLLIAADEVANAAGAVIIRLDAEASLGESRYRLVDPFFAEWIAVSQAP